MTKDDFFNLLTEEVKTYKNFGSSDISSDTAIM